MLMTPSTEPPASDKYRDWTRRPKHKNIQYRSRIQVAADIIFVMIEYVETAEGRSSAFDRDRTGIPTASLMYGASLNFNQMKDHVKELLHYQLIEKDRVSNTFKAAHKGREFLKTYEHLKSLLPAIERKK